MPQVFTRVPTQLCNILGTIVQGANSLNFRILPAGVPCIVSASLGSVAPNDILLQAVRLEPSSADTGILCASLKNYELLFQAAADMMYAFPSKSMACIPHVQTTNPARLSVVFSRFRMLPRLSKASMPRGARSISACMGFRAHKEFLAPLQEWSFCTAA